ncbi:UDP-N-acetylmuramoyl-L-alanine--D-glutamate ligase [uncultured Corynebacterium sp.]|uniref:UDP-N-acetylmuramoyl-L-alanine--D-glutamate ligase n=1 Tax=uncultured Corynebacterium sp. TaxID=159447 RepID=UPI0025F46B8D|nr:UDP-N-acetylmuramoyl-L-alanine--D-glutamate ligase [uncultured Corynebacterium sp.]
MTNSHTNPAAAAVQALPEELRGRILIAGAGMSGLGCARLLAALGADLTVADDNAQHVAQLPAGVPSMTTAEAQGAAATFDIVVTSPGWRPDSPLLVAAAHAGIPVIGDVELAYRLDRHQVFGSPRTWLVVTGTNGKTTTTGMLASIMAADAARTGKRALAVGNIGVSVYDALADTERVDVLVAELSSFQLHWSSELTPDVGVLLNLADDHLDWHGSFEAYALAKAKVLSGANAVVGRDDEFVREYTDRMRAAGLVAPRVVGFTAQHPAVDEVGVDSGRLVSTLDGSPEPLCSVDGIEPAGISGVLDAAAAAAAALLAGALPESVAAGLSSYRVAGHRGAVVHEHAGVRYVDNSKATNPHAADAALAGLDSVVWVAGGQLKGAHVDQLIEDHAPRLKAAVLLGVDRRILADALAALAPQVPVTVIDETDPEAAMDAAVAAAVQHAGAGDTVLLAPAAASLDMYPGMGVRGDMFAAAARAQAHD